MARINVEDSIYRDPRFVRLCAAIGNMEEALGTMVLVWDAAQRAFWAADPEAEITVSVADLRSKLKHFEAIASAGLIRLITTEEAYVCGSKEAFAELRAKRIKNRDSGRLGGKRSGEVRVNKEDGSETKRNEANASKSKRKQAKRSSSTSTSIIPFPSETGELAALAPCDRTPVGLWVKAWKEKYGFRYPFKKMDFGYLKTLGEQYGPDQCEVLFACYMAITDPLYANAKHPLSLFNRDLARVAHAAQSGRDPSQPEKFDVRKLKD